MTPEEFDRVYLAIARGLTDSGAPDLFRDRLILLLAQQVDLDVALDCVRQARPPELRPLKEPTSAPPATLPHA
ncbi:hypothetical protein [Actinomadura macra]|uniref:hypothetical protein n=1 Tax=Actinomadura macra TaxID=46164 RepID=UPI000829F64A|nr:hypothetical protein [Actinomadura macra]